MDRAGAQFMLGADLRVWQVVWKVGDFIQWGPGSQFNSSRVRFCQVSRRMGAKGDLRILARQVDMAPQRLAWLGKEVKADRG